MCPSLGLPCRIAQNFILGSGFSDFVAGHHRFGVFQDEGATVSEVDFRGRPRLGRALVPEFEVGFWLFVFVVGDPTANGLPGRVDGFDGVDIKRWFWWWWQAEEGLRIGIYFFRVGLDGESESGSEGSLCACRACPCGRDFTPAIPVHFFPKATSRRKSPGS